MRAILRGAALATSLGLLVALGVGPAAAADEAVTITDFAFSPSSVTISEGDTVTWTNADGISHTATGDGGAFDAGTLADGASASVTFDTAGTYDYACAIHPAMTGTVVVEAAATTEPSADGPALTPAATDTAPADPASEDGWALVPPLLALLGISMLVLTVVSGRRRATD